MRDLEKLEFNPVQEEVVKILMARTQNNDPSFFRLMVAYFFTKIASMMRVHVKADTYEGLVPVNMYVINLAVSGSGKGRSINIIEDHVIDKFRERYLNETFPGISDKTLAKLAIRRANRNQTSPDSEEAALQIEFNNAGPMVFSFDSGTSAAVKQMRHKLLLAGSGSMNMEIDEIGSNLLSNQEVLNTFLELFDVGKIKQKLTKHTRDNVRTEELYGRTPANMMLFGTPTKLLNGAKTEEEFYSMLETGFARRCFFGYSKHRAQDYNKSAEDIYDVLTDASANNQLLALSDSLSLLAEMTMFDTTLPINKLVNLELIEYRQHCDRKADTYSEYEETRKAELKHRYFKAMKLAGAYAFIERAPGITEDHLYQAIAMTEMSGDAFERILKRDRPWAKLASYICTIGREVTHADLVEDLPFYKGTERDRKEMMSLAIAYGARNNLMIKRDMMDNIETFSGKSLAETNLDTMILSYSQELAVEYLNSHLKWNKMYKMVTAEDYHWCAHQLVENLDYPGMGGYRDEAHIVPGFNMAVVDMDGGIGIDTIQMLLEEHSYLMHTTKRSTDETPRVRIIFPLSHVLELDAKEYREFMRNVYEWLPFEVDKQTNQRSRKWLTNPGDYWYNEGLLLDVYQFLPKTKKAEERKARIASQGNLNALERWFVDSMEEGNRNNMLARYAFALVDMGQDLQSVQNNVLALNNKLDNPLPEAEVLGTVLMSANKKIHERENDNES